MKRMFINSLSSNATVQIMILFFIQWQEKPINTLSKQQLGRFYLKGILIQSLCRITNMNLHSYYYMYISFLKQKFSKFYRRGEGWKVGMTLRLLSNYKQN